MWGCKETKVQIVNVSSYIIILNASQIGDNANSDQRININVIN
jgi:hypothetical protein